MKKFLLLSLLLFSSTLFAFARPDSSSAKVDTSTVENAIARGIYFLKRGQGVNGSWNGGCQGTTALAMLAIVNNGIPEDCEETINKAVDFLASNPRFDRVYESALLAMALQSLDAENHKSIIEKCAEFLGESQLPTGMWTYKAISEDKWNELKKKFDAQQAAIAKPGRSTNNNMLPAAIWPGDNSNTQFALLGLRAARRAGVNINMNAVRSCQEHFMRSQNQDEGWGYPQYRGKSCGSMTSAGIGSLCILDDELKAGSYFKRRKIRKNNLAKGIQWMSNNFSASTNPGSGKNYLYYMYSMERAGALSGRKQFGEHDWYAESWPVLCGAQKEDGSWSGPRSGRSSIYSDTAFAVLFLKKAQKYHGVKPL